MEERTGWSGAFETAWGNLTGINNEGNVRAIRLLFFVVFMLGTAWAGWYYMQGIKLIELEEFYPTSPPGLAQADKKRLDTLIDQVEVTSQLRRGSPEAVRIIEENLAKYPFGEPRFDVGVTVVDPESPDTLRPVVFIDYPPEGITLRGIMIMGNQRVAVIDIPGVGAGMIVKAGDTFMQKKGRVVRVAPDKVVINWGGKNWDIAPSF